MCSLLDLDLDAAPAHQLWVRGQEGSGWQWVKVRVHSQAKPSLNLEPHTTLTISAIEKYGKSSKSSMLVYAVLNSAHAAI